MKTKIVLIAVLAIAAAGTGLLQYMERTRAVEGTWLYQFEGSDFFEGKTPAKPCGLYTRNAAWLDYRPKAVYPDYRYDKAYPSSGIYRSHYGIWRIEAFSVKFKGRQKFALFSAGHFGGWNSEFEVDQMISVKPISNLDCFDAER